MFDFNLFPGSNYNFSAFLTFINLQRLGKRFKGEKDNEKRRDYFDDDGFFLFRKIIYPAIPMTATATIP